MNARATLHEQLAEGIEKVLSIPNSRPYASDGKPVPTKITPERIREQMGSIRDFVENRRVSTRKGLTATLENLAAQKKAEKDRHREAMATIAEREATARQQAKADTERDQLLIAVTKAALATLDGK